MRWLVIVGFRYRKRYSYRRATTFTLAERFKRSVVAHDESARNPQT